MSAPLLWGESVLLRSLHIANRLVFLRDSTVQLLSAGVQSVGKLLLLPNDRDSAFKPPGFIDPRARRAATWHSCDISVVDVKRIG